MEMIIKDKQKQGQERLWPLLRSGSGLNHVERMVWRKEVERKWR